MIKDSNMSKTRPLVFKTLTAKNGDEEISFKLKIRSGSNLGPDFNLIPKEIFSSRKSNPAKKTALHALMLLLLVGHPDQSFVASLKSR